MRRFEQPEASYRSWRSWSDASKKLAAIQILSGICGVPPATLRTSDLDVLSTVGWRLVAAACERAIIALRQISRSF